MPYGLAYGALTLCGPAFQTVRHARGMSFSGAPTTPARALKRTPPVWALPRSLATTRGITVVFSSWGY